MAKKNAIFWFILMMIFGLCCFVLGALTNKTQAEYLEPNMKPPCGDSFNNYSMEYYESGRLKSWKCIYEK